ncbi:MAG: FliH/SctL family protein [Desulfopila sp.]
MSKIIKNGKGFEPSQIVPGDVNRPPVWENLAKNIEIAESKAAHRKGQSTSSKGKHHSKQQGKAEDTTSAGAQHAADHPAARQSAEGRSQSFDTDFSSPESEPVASKEKQVDLDALADASYRKGLQAGIEQAAQDYGHSIAALQSICEQLNSIRDTILHNSMEEMQNLVLCIAEKILRQSVASQQQTILQTVEDAVQQTVKSDDFVISVNPEDLATIKLHGAEIAETINGLENIVIKSDPSIDQGGCLIESSNCTVDATLLSQLEIIGDAIKKQ